MPEVLAASVAFPTVVFTALLAISLAYWLLVLVGAVDLDGGDVEGAAKGAMEGAAKAAMEGAAKGALEGAAKASAEGLSPEGGDSNGLATLFTSLAHARFVLMAWRHDYNHVRPHSKLGGQTPAEIAGQWSWGHAPRTIAITSTNHHEGAGLYL